MTTVHEGVKPFKCDICGATFTKISKIHKAAIHEEKIYTASFTNSRYLNAHILSVHEEKSHTNVTFDNKCWIRIATLQLHQFMILRNKAFQCEVCD